ncbi:MAG: outer membrane lipoprotein chaperone LolA [Steroidobacteraceae bacterium]|nr:outer membrane lipoprotein chaperone LolA [Steroidobacteraceae bacterium]
MRSRNARGILLTIALMLAAVPAVAVAAVEADSLVRVEAWLKSVHTLSADFVQVVRNRDGQISSRVTGTLSLSRPDRFRWDYRDPYVQVIVADGRKLWLYDADLEQVTVRPLESGLGSTPAMLLSGTGSVGESFTSGPVERDGDWTWCRLVPRQHGSDFESVSLGFDDRGGLVAMQLVDKLGQSTELSFSDVALNQKLDPALFQFTPPKGADVIGDTKP